MAFNYSPKIVTNGLILALDAANPRSYTSGSISWTDLSRGGNNGTLTNGPTFNTERGGNIVFDGTNDYVAISSTNTVYSALTFIAIINTTTQSGGAGIIFNRGVGGNTSGMNILYPNGGGIGYHWNDDSNTYNYNPGLTLPNNAWCFCCVSVSPTQAIFQINGNSVVRTYTNPSANTTIGAGLQIGADASINRFFQTKIAYASMYNRALSQTEIQQNYNALKGRFGL